MDLPQHMRADDPAAADAARRRLLQKSPLPRFPSLPSLRPPKRPTLSPPADNTTDDIRIECPLPPLTHDTDTYHWAILYENQRGITLFSAPFYSSFSLLPSDPQPFTIPDAHASRRHLPNLSLDNYPLPDGTWRWVSTAWMIDMRSDLGEVQHDGFEYNWRFRRNHWHAQVGKLSTGAWVRRRRWIRLMMRPASRPPSHDNGSHPTLSSLPPVSPPSKLSLSEQSHVWDGSDQDWQYTRRLFKRLGRDGRKLELWRRWLGPHAHASNIKAKNKQSDPLLPENRLLDPVLEENSPPLVHLTAIFRNHGEAILHSFVYPDSRAQFVHLVGQAGMLDDLEHGLGRVFSASDVDFWSYADNLDKLTDRD